MTKTILFLSSCERHKQRDEVKTKSLANDPEYRTEFLSLGLDELDKLAFQPFCSVPEIDSAALIDNVLAQVGHSQPHGIVSTGDYPGSILSSIVAQRLNLLGPQTDLVLKCQHKYYARLLQRQYVPSAVPGFAIINPRTLELDELPLSFPLFIKPVKAYFSLHAHRVRSLQELRDVVPTCTLPQAFLAPFNYFLGNYTDCEFDGSFVIAEAFLRGWQTTVEGFVSNGNVTICGVVDSVVFPGTICFKRFEYPSSLPTPIQERMNTIARKCVAGIGIDHTFFNIEMMYNCETDTIAIIEINPRIAAQFADLYERVDGTNTYRMLCDIAVGKSPSIAKRAGPFACAASCVLRTFQDHTVHKLPSEENIARIKELFPDACFEVCAREGHKLSEELQDGKSFRYGLVSLGGLNRKDVLRRFAAINRMLDFDLRPV